MSAVDLHDFGSRLLAELRTRRSLNDTLFRHLCRSLLPTAVQVRHNANDPILDMADDKDAPDGRLLELYTAILLQCQGHAVISAGGAKNDGGVDVMVRSAAAGSGSAVRSEGGAVMVQCKQYRDSPVNVDVLVQLLGAMNIRTVQHGLLVTSSEVTDGVKQLERHLDRRYEQWERKGSCCSSCGNQQRPLRAQVWDRNTLVALLDQHAAAFVELRERLVQRLLDDQQLMRLIRLKRGADYCVRHAIHDPHTFPHDECRFGCRPFAEEVDASASLAAGGRQKMNRVRSLYKKAGYNFPSQRRLNEYSEEQPTSPPALAATTSSPQTSTTPLPMSLVRDGATLPLAPAADVDEWFERVTLTDDHAAPHGALRTPRPDRFSSTSEPQPSSSNVGRAGDTPTSVMVQPREVSSEQAEEANAENEAVLLLSEETDSGEDSDDRLSQDSARECGAEEDEYETPDEAESDPDTKNQTLHLSTGDDTDCQATPRSTLPTSSASLPTTAVSLAFQHATPTSRRDSNQHRSPLQELHMQNPGQPTPDRQRDNSSHRPQLESSSTKSLPQSDAVLAICDGENGEMFIAGGLDENDETPLEMLSDDEVAVNSPPSAAASSHHSALPALLTPANSLDKPARPAYTAPPRPAPTPRRQRHVTAPATVPPPTPVMTGEEERRIAARIDDERAMEADEIEPMLQLILTRPAPHHHIHRPSSKPILVPLPSPQPQPRRQRNKQADMTVEAKVEAANDEEEESELKRKAAATTVNEEQEEEQDELEEMDRLSSDDEAEASCRSSATFPITIPPIKQLSDPLQTPTHLSINHPTSPPHTLIRPAAIKMRPIRTPRNTHSTARSADDKVFYTDREVRELILLYRKHGGHGRRFVSILNDPACHWLHVDKAGGGRDNVGLKDKWRNLTTVRGGGGKCDVLTAMCCRIEREAREQRVARGIKEGKQAMKRKVKEQAAGRCSSVDMTERN